MCAANRKSIDMASSYTVTYAVPCAIDAALFDSDVSKYVGQTGGTLAQS